jgi:hypothetical protein
VHATAALERHAADPGQHQPRRLEGDALRSSGPWCAPLAVRVVGATFPSAWEPTPAAMEMLKTGGNVILTVFGGQPAMWRLSLRDWSPGTSYCAP